MSGFRVLVGCKKVIDYAVRIRVNPEQTAVVTKDVKHSMNPFDEIALEEAVRMKEKGIASHVSVVTCAPENHKDVLLTALAMGADKAFHVHVPDAGSLQPYAVAKILGKIIEKHPHDIVILGKQILPKPIKNHDYIVTSVKSIFDDVDDETYCELCLQDEITASFDDAIDDDSNQTAQLLAGFLNWSQATCLASLKHEKGEFLVEREIDGGTETLSIKPPFVLSADLRLNKPRYPNLSNIMKAKSKPMEIFKPDALGVDISPKLQTVSVTDPPKRAGGVSVGSVDELLTKLAEKGFVNI